MTGPKYCKYYRKFSYCGTMSPASLGFVERYSRRKRRLEVWTQLADDCLIYSTQDSLYTSTTVFNSQGTYADDDDYDDDDCD